MRVYVESNFVLEIALSQEEHEACQGIIRWCEAGRAQLAIPAFSLAEPYHTLIGRHRHRKQLKQELNKELDQLARTEIYSEQLAASENLVKLLVDSVGAEVQRFERIYGKLIGMATILPLESETLAAATRYQESYGLSLPDALILASVIVDLKTVDTDQSCFLNRNSRDFDEPQLVTELAQYNCKFMSRFDSGYDYIRATMRQSC